MAKIYKNFNEITADVNKLKKNLNILNKKIEDEENNDRAKRKNDEKTINEINNDIDRIINYINMKFGEQENINFFNLIKFILSIILKN